ncbi:TPA: class I SAM-dependent methyltransferase [Candidatus Woesearchaeota archaeon]|nr:class I SAM-dependent methyltransferase [Candidatus Woesearchaeota archaeon]
MIWDDASVTKYKEYDNSELRYIHPILLEMLGEVQRKKIIDYGCGEGKFLEELLQRGAEIYGYDISEAMIAQSRKRVGISGELAVTESGKIPLPDNSVDGAVSNLVLMMCGSVQTVDAIFKEVGRVLKPQSPFVFCITHPAFTDRIFTTYRNIFPRNWSYSNEGQPYQFVLRREDGTEITHETFVDHHYPLSTYFNVLVQNNFLVTGVRELVIPGNDYPPYLVVKSTPLKTTSPPTERRD